MTIPLGRAHRLVQRGNAGLACDRDGVTLGAVILVQARLAAGGKRWCEVRSPREVGEVLQAAYGPQPDEVVLRCHRGLRRAAACIEAGDLGRAGVEAIMLRFPELTPAALAKLTRIANLEKGGTAWEEQPRLPAGQSGGGQWTEEGVGAPTTDTNSASRVPSAAPFNPAPALSLDDGVYRPDVDNPRLIYVGGAEDNEPPGIGSNRPPDDFISLQEVFPGLKEAPFMSIPLAPVDGFLGISSLADSANAAATLAESRYLTRQIRAIEPDFPDDEVLPKGDILAMPEEGRRNYINSLRMQRASVFYRLRGDVEPLQVETLRFVQEKVDETYGEALNLLKHGRIKPIPSREMAIGNYIDSNVRRELKELFNEYYITYGRNTNIYVNNRDYNTSGAKIIWNQPDARIGDVSFDWTLELKTISKPQVRGFFGADSRPSAVVIVRPSQLGQNSMYLIPRPATAYRGK